MDKAVLYLKIDKNVQAKKFPILLGDIAAVSCSAKTAENRVKELELPAGNVEKPGRYVFSIFDVIQVIQKEYPELEISNLGEGDFIITVEKERKLPEVFGWGKTALVCFLAFFGAAFSIMAFNNDVGITVLFEQLYEMFTGNHSDGFTILEISYSIGVGLGILIFFHHFSRKGRCSDPTPLEVEMRTYEDEIDTTLIESGSRQKN